MMSLFVKNIYLHISEGTQGNSENHRVRKENESGNYLDRVLPQKSSQPYIFIAELHNCGSYQIGTVDMLLPVISC